MPLYDYICEECGCHFTRLLPIDDRDKAKCPQCGSDRVGRQLPLLNFIREGKGLES